jgi:tetratricopeptide (TPR) repeat protein
MGEIYNENGDYLDAEKEYRSALDRYEEAKALRRLTPRDEFGKIYANLGDLYYYVAGDYNTALDLYIQGEQDLHVTPGILYRKGYIYFRREDYRRALNEFYSSAGGFTRDPNLLYATAAALYRRNDFFSAQGYYIQLIEQLERQRESIPVLLIDEKEEHRALVENLMMAYNNLGVTLNRLYLSTGDPQKNADSLVQFARSSDYFDYLSRDPETMRRSSTINLAHINTKTLLYPLTDYQLQIYGDIPMDRQVLSFR